MPAPHLDKLLILQDRDSKRLGFEAQLKSIPREVAAVEARIAAERSAIETAKAEWHGLESKKKQLELEIKAAEEKIGKYRTQQSQVRKNDEYQALTHEIDTTQASIGTLEEQEIAVMLSIDEAKQRFAAAEAELKKNITGHEARIRTLREHEAQLNKDVAAAQADVAAARPEVPVPYVRIYDRIAVKPGHPVCVTVNGGRCGGCHLKVPTHIEVMARNGSEIATCDQCGRILYWQS
ncbi:MAG: C4-type zinc ribbon domain-containing protein [bacterium]|nr:C4-type zinc ribbon domain-containing protein [bacterium]MDI1335491.1 C4-type zinc ribbon domain-containing protein [Lacunisphaera sp.]